MAQNETAVGDRKGHAPQPDTRPEPAVPATTDEGSGRVLTPVMLVSLALLAGVAPFGTDLYLPAFPTMVTDLSTSASGVQLSLTAFLIGAGLGQLIFGPLSDRIGRRGPLIVGMALYVVSGIAAAIAPSITVLIIARLAQGMTGSAGMVIGRAMIADVARGRQAARAMSTMMTVAGVAPVVAPITGGLFADSLGWRGLLWIVAALALISLIAAVMFLPETHGRRAREADPQAQHGTGLRSLANRTYIGHTMAMVFSFATMMAYISASPFLYQNMMGFSSLHYALAFAINATGIVACTAISARLAARVEPRRLAGIGMITNLIASVAVLLLAVSGLPSILIAVPLFFAIAPLGLVFGNNTALALDAARHNAGLASAVLGTSQFALAGLVSPLVGLAGEETAVPLGIVMVIAAVIAQVGFLIATTRRRGDARQPAQSR